MNGRVPGLGRLPGTVAAVFAAVASAAAGDETTDRVGGDTTVYVTGFNAFSMAAANLDEAGRTRFAIGNSFFRRNWVEAPSSTAARDGLGPLFIARSCGACHPQGGRGAPPSVDAGQHREQPMSLLFRLSVPGVDEHGGPVPEPTYGDQFRIAAVRGVPPDGRVRIAYREQAGRFPDGEPYSLRTPVYRFEALAYGEMHPRTMVGPRIAPQLIGMGLLEAIAEADILDNARAQLRRDDAIHGIPNRVWDAFTGTTTIGRFGWKANVGSLAHQTAAAFQADMGITSTRFPHAPCTAKQVACLAAPRGGRDGGPEIDDRTLADVIFNQAVLAPPAARDPADPSVRRGAAAFAEARCDVCHRPVYTTAAVVDGPYTSAVLGSQTIRPYTDLLLHDMGEGLADGRPDYLASGRQWRTPPLWGIGLVPDVNGHSYLLHDGRARGIMEAILWHDGEAREARDRVVRMDREERMALVKFVESL
jgi:CxxC motif-containing protein (DUF1111 family)